MPLHACPVCGTVHFVSALLDELVHGRPLTCSPRCKVRWPGLVRARVLREMEERRRARGALAGSEN